MKKTRCTLILLFFLLFLTSFVSSAYYTPGRFGSGLGFGVSQLIEIIEDISYPLAASLFGSTEYIFEKLLFLLIIVSLVYIILKNMPIFSGDGKTEKSIRWIITIAIGLLATRFMVETELIQTMILPYSVLGVVLTSALPLIIYFFFVTTALRGTTLGYSVMRKILWILFGVVFLGIWNSRSYQLGELSWIYFATGMLSFLFLFLDGTINKALINAKYGELNNDARILQIQKIRDQISDLENKQTHPATALDKKDFERIKKRLKDNIKMLSKGI
jgi:hypothetical protein